MRKHAKANDSCLSIRQTPKAAIIRPFYSEPRVNHCRQRHPQLRESPLKEVQYVVRTIALNTSICPTSATCNLIVLLCAPRQSATRNRFFALVRDAFEISPTMITDILQITRISWLFLLRVIVFFVSATFSPAGFTHDS